MYVLLMLCVNLFAMVGAATAPEHSLNEADQLFKDFISQYDKQYDTEQERQRRFKIFKDNLEHIKQLNTKNGKDVYGITKFTDLTMEEFLQMYTGLDKNVQGDCKTLTDADIPDVSAPDSFDWRDRNVVTPAKNQAHCGSCYAFSSTGHLEGQYAIKHQQLVSFSEQQIVDCVQTTNKCGSGMPISVFSWLIDNGGLEIEDDYPYAGCNQTCSFNPSEAAVQVTDCYAYHLSSQDKLKQLLYKKGPLSIGFRSHNLNLYKNNIITECSGDIDHAVLLVGYGSDSSGSYWIVKNSWGADFGLSGYFYVGQGDGADSCGIMSYISGADIA